MKLTAEQVKEVVDKITDNTLLPATNRTRIKKLADEVLSNFSNEEELKAKYALFLSLVQKI